MGSKHRRARTAAAVALCWLPCVAVIWTVVTWWHLVFDDISTQWAGGEVSTTAPAWTVLLLPLGGTLICGTIATAAGLDPDGRGARRTFFFCFGVGTMLAFIWIGVMALNVSASEDPPAPTWLFLSPVLVLLGLVPWAVAGPDGRRDFTVAKTRPDLPRPAGERVWVGTAWSPLLVLVGCGAVVVAAAVAVVGFTQRSVSSAAIASIVSVVILLAVVSFGRLSVAVDPQGLRVRSAIGVRLKTIPIARIRDAQATVLSVSSWGGLGYRVGPEGTALVLRSGPALTVATDSGRFSVTVDEAPIAAAVLRDAIASFETARS